MADVVAAKKETSLLLLYASSLGASLFFMGVLDGLFFQSQQYEKEIFGFALGREDLYYASLTFAFALVCAACALAVKIGRELKPSTLRFFAFTAANMLLFSIWIWALGWMQISPTMGTGINKPLDLWRFGPLVIFVNTADFPTIILAAFLLHLALFYAAIKVDFLRLGAATSPSS
jgi:hypothetical protein